MTTTFNTNLVNAAATSQTIMTFVTTPNIYILAFFARVKTAFAGVTAPTVKLGTRTTTDAYVAAQSISQIGDLYTRSTIAYMPEGMMNLIHPAGAYRGTTRSHSATVQCRTPISYQKTPSNVTIVATFASTAGNLSSLTAGEIEFVCVYCE